MTPAQQKVYSYLLRYGYVAPYAPEDVPGAGRERSIGMAPPASLAGFQDVIRGLLKGFDPDLPYTEANILKMVNAPRCGCADMVVQGASRYGWPHKNITFYCNIALSGFTLSRIRELYTRAIQSWADVCGIDPKVVLVRSQANVASDAGPIDGPGNVLAYAYLPVDVSSTVQLTQLYDNRDRWTEYGESYLLGVMAHELGHSLGLTHGNSGDLMQPTASAALAKPQPNDIRRIQGIYGAKAPTPTPTPTPDPTPNPTPTPTDYIVIEVGGKRYRVAATLLGQGS